MSSKDSQQIMLHISMVYVRKRAVPFAAYASIMRTETKKEYSKPIKP